MTKKKQREWGRWMAAEPAFKEGGQGRLYLVSDNAGEFSGNYVLKELKNPSRVDRFNTELQAIATLDEHPNVVPLIDSGIYRDPDKPCFVMPKADGTLEDLINSNVLSVEDRLRIFDKVCEGMAHLHKKFIIHRDIKPENVLMFGGIPRISDLGLCLIAGTPRFTPSSEAIGPRFYMAPELEEGRQPNVGFESDIYSLGKVLYYALSGGRIFSREKHRNRDYRLSILTGDSRLELFDPVFDKSITLDRMRRYRSAGEMQEGFHNAFSKFSSHPLTTILNKFQRIDKALLSSESELLSLTNEEWAELLSQAKQKGVGISQHLLNSACNSLDIKFAQLFADALLENEMLLDVDFLAFAAGRIFCLPKGDGLIYLRLQHGLASRLAMHALRQTDDDVLNAIAKWDLFTFRHCDEVLTKLAENVSRLQPDAVQSFLIISRKSSYRQKEKLLLSLIDDESLDNISLEAVVAGLCSCATKSTINRVIELADKRSDMDEKLAAIGRGIVYGSSVETAIELSRHNWSNPAIKLLIDMMQRTKDEASNE